MIANENICRREDIAAYLDSELNGEDLTDFERHLKSCGACAAELRAQRQLLCTLDAAFNQSHAFRLPRDFTRVIAAHAESHLSCMRQSERGRAIRICAALALLSFAFLGTAARTMVVEPARASLRAAKSILDLAWQTSYDAGSGLVVIVRVTGRAIVSAPHGLGMLMLLAFIVSLSLLTLLITKYHRAEI